MLLKKIKFNRWNHKSLIASDHAPQEDQIQQMESQIIEKQMDMNQSFEQKTKEYYQSILYN